MASITSLGSGSGLDLSGLLEKLVEAESKPTTNRLNLKEAETQAKISAFGNLKSALSELSTLAAELKNLSKFQQRTATSSNESLFTATAASNAAVGSSNIYVLNLASAHKLATGGFSGPEESIGTGLLTIEAGGSSFNVEITDGSVAAVRDAINASNAGEKVTASIINVDNGLGGTESKLVLTSKQSGASNAIEITVDDDDGIDNDGAGLSQLFFVKDDLNNQLSELNEALNGKISVDGFTVTSATNEFKDAIDGVTINALKASEDPINDPPEVLTVELNQVSVEGKIATFIATYNGLKTTLKALSAYNPETGQAGLLNGDSTVRNIDSQIDRIVFGSLNSGSGVYKNLVELGITTDDNGLLELDNEKLSSAITNNFDDIGELFAGDNGFAVQLDALLERFLAAGGNISIREEGLKNRIDEINEDRAKLAQRVAATEARFRQQFANLDVLVSQLNSTGDFLIQQLNNTASIISGNTGSNRNNSK